MVSFCGSGNEIRVPLGAGDFLTSCDNDSFLRRVPFHGIGELFIYKYAEYASEYASKNDGFQLPVIL